MKLLTGALICYQNVPHLCVLCALCGVKRHIFITLLILNSWRRYFNLSSFSSYTRFPHHNNTSPRHLSGRTRASHRTSLLLRSRYALPGLSQKPQFPGKPVLSPLKVRPQACGSGRKGALQERICDLWFPKSGTRQRTQLQSR